MIEHKTISLADQVFDHLENDILSGKYQRGEILTESKLSAELGVSRTPIREALRRLEQEHIIEESGKGSVVIGINEKDLEDIFMIRKSLECQVAALAAKNRTEEQLKQLREALEFQEFYLNKKDPDQIKLMDSRFHETLYKLSGSTAFYDTLVLCCTRKFRNIAAPRLQIQAARRRLLRSTANFTRRLRKPKHRSCRKICVRSMLKTLTSTL